MNNFVTSIITFFDKSYTKYDKYVYVGFRDWLYIQNDSSN